jgi:hypothetical protein
MIIMQREVALFINQASATRAGQAAVQEKGGTYHLHVRTRRGQFMGYAVELRPTNMQPGELRIYIMEQ